MGKNQTRQKDSPKKVATSEHENDEAEKRVTRSRAKFSGKGDNNELLELWSDNLEYSYSLFTISQYFCWGKFQIFLLLSWDDHNLAPFKTEATSSVFLAASKRSSLSFQKLLVNLPNWLILLASKLWFFRKLPFFI